MEYSFIEMLILFFAGGVITLLIRLLDEKYSYKKYNDLSKEIIMLRRDTSEYFDGINNDVMLLIEDIQQLKEKVLKLEGIKNHEKHSVDMKNIVLSCDQCNKDISNPNYTKIIVNHYKASREGGADLRETHFCCFICLGLFYKEKIIKAE